MDLVLLACELAVFTLLPEVESTAITECILIPRLNERSISLVYNYLLLIWKGWTRQICGCVVVWLFEQ
jgi:hypothetical protein